MFTYHPKQGIVEFFNGSKIYLRGLDVLQGGGERETTKAIAFIRGLNLGWYAVDQAEAVSQEIVEHLDARLSRDVPFHQAMLTSNPTNFWGYDVYKRNVKEGYRLLEVSLFENEANLPKDYVERQKEFQYTRPRYYQQYVLGEWDEFMMSENTVIEAKLLEKLKNQRREPVDSYKDFLIYRQPNDKHTYQIGVDPTEGQHDRASVSVVDRNTGEEVAKYAKKVLYDVLAEKVWEIAQYYGNIKRVVPEANNHALVMELQNYKLRLYQDKNLNDRDQKELKRLGFTMTRDKKRFLVDNFEQLLSEGRAVVYDKETIAEFNTFVHTSKVDRQGMGAATGSTMTEPLPHY
jgi:hypothetical protein